MVTRTVNGTATIEGGRRPDVEAELSDRYAVTWSYLTGVPPSAFDREKSLHNQARFEALDPATVETYAAGVERGDIFPAVIAYRASKGGKLVNIDGNHRYEAHAIHNMPLDVYEVAQGTDTRLIALMSYAFNTRHGKPTSEAERIVHARFLVDNNSTIEDAATAVNLPVAAVRKAVQLIKAQRRADRVGIPRSKWDDIPSTTRTRLLTIGTDEGFEALTRLTIAASLSWTDIAELATQVNNTQSAATQVELVKVAREGFAHRIQLSGGGVFTSGTNGKRPMTARGRLTLALGNILAIEDDTDAIVAAYGAAERRDAAKRFRTTSARLEAVARELERLDKAGKK